MSTTASHDPNDPVRSTPDTTAASAPTWATGPLDAVWHRVRQSRFGSLLCACGRYVVGPVHLRRCRPAEGELGRALCPTVTGLRRESNTDQQYLPELAADETSGRTGPAVIWPPRRDESARRPAGHTARPPDAAFRTACT